MLKKLIDLVDGLSLDKIKHYVMVVLAAIILALAGYAMLLHGSLARTRVKLQISRQNTAAAVDSLRRVATKSGDSMTVKISFLVAKGKDLEKLNAALAKKAKDQPGQVHTIADVGIQIDHAPISAGARFVGGVAPFRLIDSTAGRAFNMSGTVYLYSEDSARIAMEKFQMELLVTTGISTVDGKLQAFAKSDNPDVKITTLNSASFDPGILIKPPSRFWLGMKCLGIGICVGAAADELVRWYFDRRTRE